MSTNSHLDPQQEALLLLLNDDDRDTTDLLKRCLIQRGVAALPELRELLSTARGRAGRTLREVISQIEISQADSIFAQVCARFGEDGDLEEAAWRLSAVFHLSENMSAWRRLIDKWGKEVALRMPKAETRLDKVETLSEFLHMEQGLSGNEADYYNIENSVLPRVIETRLGNPITLSLIYMMVGRRAGLDIKGVGLPGHFIVRYEDLFFDPFHSGRCLRLEDCRELLMQQGTVLEPAHLMPATPRQMLARMLSNIHGVAEVSDYETARKVCNWLRILRGATDCEG